MSHDYYKILGVERSADPGTIKKAYRQLAMKYHPDKNPGDKAAEEKFKEAARAYEVLSNPDKKSRYDRFGEAGVSGSPGHNFTDAEDIFSAFGDIFGDFFGGGFSSREKGKRPARGSDLRYVQEIDLKEVISGCEKTVEFKVEKNCSSCNGTGAEKGTTPETCPSCGGSGQVVKRQGFFQMATTCQSCHGRGTIVRVPCRKCDGEGRELSEKKLKVNIPAGVEEGNQLRLSGEGEGGYLGGPAGDLYVEVIIKPEKNLFRKGQNLYSEIKVSYLQAILGTQTTLNLLGESITVDIQKGTQFGEEIKVPGLGVPSLRSKNRGDLVLKVHVTTPKNVSKKESEILAQLAEISGDSVNKIKRGLFN
jgi:molecular chaperone DnaJ